MNKLLNETQKGVVGENLVANLLILGSKGELCVSRPIIDDDGVDFVVYRKGNYKKVLFCQVKCRFSQSKKHCYFRIKKSLWQSKTDLTNVYLIAVYLEEETNEFTIKHIWLIPARDVVDKSDSKTNEKAYVIRPSIIENSKDKWSEYRKSISNLSEAILNKFK